jgi:nucleoside-diphosphate-sugar epimerase
MKIFMTGASGWIGSAAVSELKEGGHSIVGLARSDKSANALEAAGVEVIRGDIDDLNLLKEAAKNSDGVIHLAFKHDIAFSGDFNGAATADRKAVNAFAEVLEGTDKPFTIASGVIGFKPGVILTENDGHDQVDPNAEGPRARHATAEYVLSLANNGVRSSIVRLAPTNHGEGDNGFMSSIVGIAKDKGVSAYIDDGSARWPAVHRLDSAKLFRLAIERAPAGSTLHGVAEEGIAIKDIAETIGAQLNIPVKSITQEEADGHFTWLARFLNIDSPTSNKITRELLGWEPKQFGLIDDLKEGHYFRTK